MKKQIPFEIIYQDKDIMAVYKKSGLLTIGTPKDPDHNLYHYVREYLNLHREKCFIVHRLDRDTSGIVLFAKSFEMKEKLQKAFEERNVIRKYEAVVREHLPLDIKKKVVQYLFYDKRSGRVFIANPKERKGLEAITYIRTNNYIDLGTVLDINIETGRQNQIRLALHSLHYTLIGDSKYAHDEAKKMLLNEYYLELPTYLKLKQNVFTTRPLWLINKKED
ncbi:MAG: RluA family pseudouridine synthase [Bacilli bacterium]|nr:RluA family pseudouridine synthase [Bacilli bacterium]